MTSCVLSKNSQMLIAKLNDNPLLQPRHLQCQGSLINASAMVHWLSLPSHVLDTLPEGKQKNASLILTSLQTSLIHDLALFVNQKSNSIRQEPKNDKKPTSRWKFMLLAFAGVLLAACQGFDSIITLFGVFSLPPLTTLITGLCFSGLSVAIFCVFNLTQVAQVFNVRLIDASQMLNLQSAQMEGIHSIKKGLQNLNLLNMPLPELKLLRNVVGMLDKRQASLSQVALELEKSLSSNKIKCAKAILTGVAALLCFGGGFFAGQSVALFALGLVITSITAASWPVILFSSLVGVAGSLLYWFVERESVQQSVSSWFGLDEQKIEKLFDTNRMDKTTEKLAHLKTCIQDTINVAEQFERLGIKRLFRPATKKETTSSNTACTTFSSCPEVAIRP